MTTDPEKILRNLGACEDSITWLRGGRFASLDEAWQKCERGDWMLWFAAKREVDRKKLVYVACQCARLALPHTRHPSAISCIETAEAWTRDEATIEELRDARRRAYAAGAYAAGDAYAYAYAAPDAAAAAAAHAYAAPDAAAAAAAHAAAAARNKSLAESAAIVRNHISNLP